MRVANCLFSKDYFMRMDIYVKMFFKFGGIFGWIKDPYCIICVLFLGEHNLFYAGGLKTNGVHFYR